MNLSMRKCRDEEDIWRTRSFLREAYLANDRREISWPLGRFDYWRWHSVATCEQRMDLFLWETAKGDIAAVLLSESGGGDAFLNVHPDVFEPARSKRRCWLVAEEHLASPSPRGPTLIVPAREGDTLREGVLAARGYKTFDHWEDQRRLVLSGPLPRGPRAGRVHGQGTRRPLTRSRHGFGRRGARSIPTIPTRPTRDTTGTPRTFSARPCTVAILTSSPSRRPARWPRSARCGTTTRRAPATSRPSARGPSTRAAASGRAVMAEAVRRLADMGAVVMHIGGYDPMPKKLYASIGGPDLVRSMSWGKYLAE